MSLEDRNPQSTVPPHFLAQSPLRSGLQIGVRCADRDIQPHPHLQTGVRYADRGIQPRSHLQTGVRYADRGITRALIYRQARTVAFSRALIYRQVSATRTTERQSHSAQQAA